MGNVECANCVVRMAQDDVRLPPSEYDEAQVSAQRTGVTSLNIQGTGANRGTGRIRTWGASRLLVPGFLD